MIRTASPQLPTSGLWLRESWRERSCQRPKGWVSPFKKLLYTWGKAIYWRRYRIYDNEIKDAGGWLIKGYGVAEFREVQDESRALRHWWGKVSDILWTMGEELLRVETAFWSGFPVRDQRNCKRGRSPLLWTFSQAGFMMSDWVTDEFVCHVSVLGCSRGGGHICCDW